MKKFNSITVKTKTACYYYMKTTIEISEIFALKKKKWIQYTKHFFLFLSSIFIFLSLAVFFEISIFLLIKSVLICSKLIFIY